MKTLYHFALVWFVVIAQAQNGSAPARLLTVEGKVEVARSGLATWTPATTNLLLQNSDRVRTGLRSRATLQLSDRSVLRLNELTTMEVRPPKSAGANAGFELKNGASYFFNRERPGSVEFRTPLASGAIRGTEFHLLVLENGHTEVTLVDGLVDLQNEVATVNLVSGEQGIVDAGQAPRKTAVLDASGIIQWVIYYPAVLDVDEIGLSDAERSALTDSLAAYRSGDLLAALAKYPDNRQPASDAEKIYRAATLLAAGQAGQAALMIQAVSTPQAEALRQMMETVKGRPVLRAGALALAGEWMAESYALQAQSKLGEALVVARKATAKAPGFGFAWARVAELEFSFAHGGQAQDALDQALTLSPRHAQAHALRGFVLAGRSKFSAAQQSFDEAIALDGALANGWLGRGLVRIRRGDSEQGRQDLQVAATLEPQRSVLRSYLGKAWSQTRDAERAGKELRLAQKLDANDPTPWLYSAILAEQQNKVNEAVRDLEKSQELNENRSLYRSRLLLDQDKSVRSANLAHIYLDAGMTDWSTREASRAVSYDYGNFSAHQFLANSYDALRDPKQINLRYEAAAVSEYFIANLLAPVGGTRLSSTVSQQEYTRLFDANYIGLASSTEYFGGGDWVQHGVQYGRVGGTDWALEAGYRRDTGQRLNNDFEETDYTAKIRQQITPHDTLYLEVQRNEFEGGDVQQYYSQKVGASATDPNVRGASPTFRFREVQEPNLFLGYHHEWGPGSHTLFLAGRLEDDLQYQEPNRQILFFRQIDGQVTRVETAVNAVTNRSTLEGYTAELQQILTVGPHTLVVGGRFQYASMDTLNSVSSFARINAHLENTTYLDRESIYAYDQWSPWKSLQLIAGVSYDRLRFPDNIDTAPITSTQSRKDQVSPKAGVLWSVTEKTHLRAAYTRSLGGVFFDNSFRLEPTQVGGFNQAFRSLAPESSVGLVPGTRFETFCLGIDHQFPTHTYVNIDAEVLRSDASRTVGIITNSFFIPVPNTPGSARQKVEYEERSLTVSVNQLLSDEWAFGVRYRLSHADLDTRFPVVSPEVDREANVNQNESALLQQLSLNAIYNHRCGFFGEGQAIWTAQNNYGYTPALDGGDFWQFNLFAGYRFWRRHAEARVGVLNIGGQDYRLNPISLYSELPRERTFYASFKFYF